MELLENDRIWQSISMALVSRPTRVAPNTGFINICCPLCPRRGESVDRKFRCGIINNSGSTSVYCFNCNLKCGFRIGGHLGFQMRQFLDAIGVSRRDVKLLVLWAEQVRRLIETCPEAQAMFPTTPEFETSRLPDGAMSLQQWADSGCTEPNFLDTVAYLLSRGNAAVAATTYYWTPSSENRISRSVIIPCRQNNRIVGWTARYIDPGKTRYYKDTPGNFLFNVDRLRTPGRKYVFVMEGVFDALVLDGVAAMGAKLNAQQINWINQSGKQPVVVPDRDSAGARLIDLAIEQGWAVSAPHYGRHQWWEADVKDADAAVKRYGKLYTAQSILATMTTDAIQIRQRSSYRIE